MNNLNTMIKNFLKRVSTNFLRFVIFLLALGVLAFCIFALPSMWNGASGEFTQDFPMAIQAIRLIVVGMYASAIPFFILLWQSLKLLGHIDRGHTFSDQSTRALKNIKYSATIIAILYFGGVPLLFPIAQADDAPGLIVFGTLFACAPLAVAFFAALLEKLVQNGIDIKSENDLTV
jgi:hypothetical protein